MQPNQLIYLHKERGEISSQHVCGDGDLADPLPFHDVVAF